MQKVKEGPKNKNNIIFEFKTVYINYYLFSYC